MRKAVLGVVLCVASMGTFVRTAGALGVSSGDVYPVGTKPIALLNADLNHDGISDLVTLNAGSGTASVLIAQGDGRYTVSSTPSVTSPTAIAIGDINGDTKPDLVTVGSASGNVGVRYGDGTGGFPSGASFHSSSTSLSAVAVGDLNDDGRTDVVTDAPGGAVRVGLGAGNGGFTAPPGSPYAAGSAPTVLAVADMDGDRWPDVVAASGAAGTVSVLRGSSTGALTLISKRIIDTRPAAITIEDLDGDGRNDVAVAEPDASAVEVLTGDGAGNLGAGARIDAPTGVGSVAVGDLNDDGAPDVVGSSGASDEVAVALGDGRVSFVSAAGSPFAVDGAPSAVATIDADGDGVTDLALARDVPNDAIVLRNSSGRGLLASPSPVDFGSREVGSTSEASIVSVSSDGLASRITAVAVEGEGFVLDGDTCTGATVGDGHPSCAVNVRFAPAAVGDRDGTLELSYDGADELDVPLHGVGVDTTPPDTTITAHPPAASNDPQPTFAFASDDETATFECALDGGVYSPCSSPYGASVADGDHTFTVRAIDPSGNVDPSPASYDFSVDTTPPDTTITDGPSPVTTDHEPSFSFTADEANVTFECRMDEAPFAACSSPHTGAPLDDGDHIFEVWAIDAAGNADPSPASDRFEVDPSDTTAPETTIVEHPNALTNDTTPTFRFISDESGATFRCSVDGAAFEDCASPYTTGVLSEGEHTFAVAARDAAGNVDPEADSFAFTVDITKPNSAIDGPSRATHRNARFTFRFSENVQSVWCSVDGTGYSQCGTPYSGRALRAGRHVLRVLAVDAAGNREDTPAVKRFTIVRG
jgi:hypothetical protein